MTYRTRLDAVVRIRERQEERAEKALAAANSHAVKTEERATALRQVAARDHRQGSSASHWDIVERAHTRALSEARAADKAVEAAKKNVVAAQGVQQHAYKQAEVVRHAVQAKRAEMTREAARKETRELDEIASLRHWHMR
ncbi:MAG: flagellar FliJ family protein [Myxococcaceae bacterium]|nr:flagellar FliJ family protein [Myxococcaceae bacterium]